ncbi:LOW QUALITY PROTEIN: uncharacterized protein [Anser cygnoides]|uniref:LOW QUALITY PROTEIN: uncharacterized protein n=1 Tax=Anser cygnoides TaxID=8845 RepID=UPI0034D18B53
MRQGRAAGLAGLAAVLLGARGCRRRGRDGGCGGPGLPSLLARRLLTDLAPLCPPSAAVPSASSELSRPFPPTLPCSLPSSSPFGTPPLVPACFPSPPGSARTLLPNSPAPTWSPNNHSRRNAFVCFLLRKCPHQLSTAFFSPLPLRDTFSAKKSHFLSFLLLFFLAVATGRAQVQQEPWAETRDGTGINITCSHPNIQTGEYIQWYRQLPGRGPAFLVSSRKDSRPVSDPEGWLWVAADRRSSALWLAQPRLRDAAVYYCALRARGEEPGLRPGRNRGGRGRACVAGARQGHSPQGALPLRPPGPPRPAAPGVPPPARPLQGTPVLLKGSGAWVQMNGDGTSLAEMCPGKRH